MEISVFLAKTWGIILILIPVTMWFDRSNIQEIIKMIKTKEYIFMSGLFCLFLGSVMISGHNLWVSDWRTIITLFGWSSLVNGIFLLSAPNFAIKILSMITRRDILVKSFLVISFILGLYFFRVGFFF